MPSQTLYRNTVGATLSVRLPSTYNALLDTVSGQLRKPSGSLLLVALSPQASGLADYVSREGDLCEVGTYSLVAVVRRASTQQTASLPPFFFRVWPTDRQGQPLSNGGVTVAAPQATTVRVLDGGRASTNYNVNSAVDGGSA